MLINISNAFIECVSAFVSRKNISVEERLDKLVSEKKFSRLKNGTGFESFSVAEDEIYSSDFCIAAAEKIFGNTNIKREDISAVIFVTQTANYFVPSAANFIQRKLNLSKNILAFDINLGCSGFVYGLYVAASMIQNLNGKILLLCGDTVTKIISKEDVSCLSVFGDAGSAAIISKKNDEKIFFNIQTFGELAEVIEMTKNFNNKTFVHMDGATVMDFSLKYVPQNLIDLMNFAKIDFSEIEYFLMHQANKLILENLSAMLKIPTEKMPFMSGQIGNTSSASIPITLTELKRLDKKINSLNVLSGFGVGMSVASAVVDLKDLICLPTGEF